jgi:hypothetical protein
MSMMSRGGLHIALASALAGCGGATTPPTPQADAAPNGITIPPGYENWRVIGVSHRTDKTSLRAILGNEIAIQAAAANKTNPWPESTIMAKLVWQDRTHESWDTATVPGKFQHLEFIIKDSARFSATGGWGYARWLGPEKKPSHAVRSPPSTYS